MAQTVNFGSGTTPAVGDTRWVLLVKKLKALQAVSPAPSSTNNPSRHDTVRTLRVKIVRATKTL